MMKKYKRGVSLVFLTLMVAILTIVPQATATPVYSAALQTVYGTGACSICHIGTPSDVVFTTYGTNFSNQPGHSTDPEAALRAIGSPFDTQLPVIKSVMLNISTPNVGNNVLISANVTDNVGVVNATADIYNMSNVGVPNVAVDHIILVQNGSMWSGTTVARNGTYSVNVSASDAAGNVAWNNSTSYTAIGDIDDILPPVINSVMLNVSTPNVGSKVLITANVTDNIGLVGVVADIYNMSNVGVSNVAVDHVILVKNGSMWSGTTVARNGTYSVNVSASDAAGNVAWNNSTKYTAISDMLPPMINSVMLNVSTPNVGSKVLITANVTDNIGLVGVVADVYKVSSVGVSNVAVDHIILVQNGSMWSGTTVARNGTYSVNVSASDAAGNVAWNNSTSYTAIGDIDDILPPVINSVMLNVSTPNTGDSILVAANVTDDIGLVGVVADVYSMPNVGVSNVAVDHIILVQNGSMWSGTIVARNGTYSVNVSASDAAGNVAWNNSTSYTATDKLTLAFEFSVSNSSLTVAQNVSAIYMLTIKNTGQLPDMYNLTVDNPNNATFNLSNKSISLNPGQNYTATLTVSGSTAGKYTVNVTATSSTNSSKNISISTETIVVPSYIKAFYVGNGTRAGSINAYVKVVNIGSMGHWFTIVVGGIDPITGYPLVGTGTVYLNANQTVEKVPVLITVPAATIVGTYDLYVGIYNYDTGVLNQDTILGTIQGPKPSIVS